MRSEQDIKDLTAHFRRAFALTRREVVRYKTINDQDSALALSLATQHVKVLLRLLEWVNGTDDEKLEAMLKEFREEFKK